ncbi:unnamed protein product [Rotaria sp. Silwood2]|nr:unnamed protein product [Rotaria sp. Silwood2]CAF2533696.1 unnamed protein product [Rotaria sp. Silwood2]CAF2785925.1 unnamed protein product [Rotaria sp. Silwood2]CAF2930956.1 unnamed protein product [Rotaria sp. Silwood2]CAF3896197.1 unnamed protein product [Rotaria sp. Silwood2]
MPIASGFTRDPNPTYSVRKPGKTEVLDESIYYKRDIPFEKPVEVVNRPIIKETVFLPDRKAPPITTRRDVYTVSPEPVPSGYATTVNAPSSGSFNLVRALGLNADCPCWAWILIVFGILLLLGLIAMCLYFIIGMFIFKSI